MDTFFEEVYQVVRTVPYGKVVSYGQIAFMLGNPRKARMVGWAMHRCPDDVPWQRVVRSDGTLAGGEFSEIQKVMLEAEGVTFKESGSIDMTKFQWT